MSSEEPKGPYVYQPYGSVTHPHHDAAGRLWAVASGGTAHMVTGCLKGLTKAEATEIVRILSTPEHADPMWPDHLKPKPPDDTEDREGEDCAKLGRKHRPLRASGICADCGLDC